MSFNYFSVYSGGEEAEDDNDEEEDAKIPLTDKLATSPRDKTLFSLHEQSPESKDTDSIGKTNYMSPRLPPYLTSPSIYSYTAVLLSSSLQLTEM